MSVWSAPTVWIGLVVVTLAAVVAVAAGGPFERRAAPWIWVGWLMTPLLQALMSEYAPALLFTLVDATLLLVLGALAWGGGRAWPMVVMGVQGLALALDLARLATPLGDRAYLTALAATSYLLLLALLASTWEGRREGGV